VCRSEVASPFSFSALSNPNPLSSRLWGSHSVQTQTDISTLDPLNVTLSNRQDAELSNAWRRGLRCGASGDERLDKRLFIASLQRQRIRLKEPHHFDSSWLQLLPDPGSCPILKPQILWSSQYRPHLSTMSSLWQCSLYSALSILCEALYGTAQTPICTRCTNVRKSRWGRILWLRCRETLQKECSK
jgi:hypothetical protein